MRSAPLVLGALLALLAACKQEKYEVGKRDDIKAWQKKHGVTPQAQPVSGSSGASGAAGGTGSADAVGSDATVLAQQEELGSGRPSAGGNGGTGSKAIVIENGSGKAVGTASGSGAMNIEITDGSGSAVGPGSRSLGISIEDGSGNPVASGSGGGYGAAQAADYLEAACATCHAKGRGAAAARWGFEPSTNALAAVDAKAYWAMKAKSRGVAAGEPPPMPSGALDTEGRAALQRFLAWLEAEKPALVEEARQRFERAATEDGATNVVLVYRCDKTMSYRRFLSRVTEDFFDRPPRHAEMELAGGELDLPVSPAQREALAARLSAADGWLSEFETVTLKKFAERLSGAAQIRPLPGLSEDQSRDLKQELYRLLLARHAEKPYRDIILGDEIMVSSNTAALYGCSSAGTGWKSCTPAAPRGSYFTSLSFLASKPSSFLAENNNYGRVKLLHFLISGDVFKSALDGGAGDGVVPPLPACLKTEDWRGTLGADKQSVAAFGAASIPASGVFCQSCHIARHMAAGSILFRPFSASGLVYGQKARLDLDPALADATRDGRINVRPGEARSAVTKASLQSLLQGGVGEQACVPDLSGQGQETKLADVKALAAFLIGDGSVLATGLARHLPRVLSNQSQTTDELIERVNRALAHGGGRLDAAFAAYLGSETYACEP